MSDEPAEGQRPEEDFEIVEVDLTPYLTDEQKSWPVVEFERPEQDFAIVELPARDVRVSGGPPERQLAALVGLFSDQEAALGGSGLQLAGQVCENGRAHATLLPRSMDGARGRPERVARWAAVLGPEVTVTVV